MKRIFIATFLLLSIFAFYSAGAEIAIEIENVSPTEGQLIIGLYREEGFPETGEEEMGVKLPADSSQITHTFNRVEPGEYAVSFFHDENGNGKHDMRLLGMPEEGYGFSRNVYNWYGGPPEFEKASFKLEQGDSVSLTIQVKNWPPQI